MTGWKKSLGAIALAFTIVATGTGCAGEPKPTASVDAAAIQHAEDVKKVNETLAKFFTTIRAEMRERNAAADPAPISRANFPQSYAYMDETRMHEEDIVAFIDKYGTMFFNMDDGDVTIEESSISVVDREAIFDHGTIIIMAGAVKRTTLAGVNLMLNKQDDGKWLITDQVPEHEDVH